MRGYYESIKKKVEDKIIGGILVTIYNKRRANKWYRTSEYVMERNRIRKEEAEQKEKEETDNEYTKDHE